MTTPQGDPGFLKALDDLRAMHLSKGGDYADVADPLRNYAVSATDNGLPAWRAAQVRLSEKYHRLINLTKDGREPNYESVEDTLMDMAALALIVKSLRERMTVGVPLTKHCTCASCTKGCTSDPTREKRGRMRPAPTADGSGELCS